MMSVPPRSVPRSAAERMRQHRELRRMGLRIVQVLIYDSEIECLIRKGYLKVERRDNRTALEHALNRFICRALGDKGAEL
jgi:hypothetical protein